MLEMWKDGDAAKAGRMLETFAGTVNVAMEHQGVEDALPRAAAGDDLDQLRFQPLGGLGVLINHIVPFGRILSQVE